MVTSELTFYLAAAALLVLTVESCLKLLNGDSFSITLAVYVTVFGWYFVDPFLNPEQYTYIPSFLISESYGQVLLFLIGFRLFMPVAVFHAGCTALDCPPAKYRRISRSAVQARANPNRHRGDLASAPVDWHCSDGR